MMPRTAEDGELTTAGAKYTKKHCNSTMDLENISHFFLFGPAAKSLL
jgi:hypothetical protein